MKPFIVKQHERSSDRLEDLRDEEIGQVAGGCPCCDITVVAGQGGKWDLPDVEG